MLENYLVIREGIQERVSLRTKGTVGKYFGRKKKTG